MPTYLTQSFSFNSSAHGTDLFTLCDFRNVVDQQPTLDVFKKRAAVLEGGVAAAATASGQSATARAHAGRVWRQDRRCGAWIQPLLGRFLAKHGSLTSNTDPSVCGCDRRAHVRCI
ncbi:hypothetical protein B0H19DRAFT_580190 [Mycena capillaripes]|nr:hypothetical protein B0H19DRAFT_580190 [Mycena capillaripes]